MTANLNLFFTLVGALTIAFLGIVVIFHDRKSLTNIIFFTHTVIISLWSIANYFSLTIFDERALFWIRAVIFLAVPHIFAFFLFVQNFPSPKLNIKKTLLVLSLIVMILMMFVAGSKWGFESVDTNNGSVIPISGSLMPVFGVVLVVISLITIWFIVKKYLSSSGLLKRQWLAIGLGLFIAYTLLVFLVFVRVVIHEDTKFVIYSPLFVMPIFIGAAYAILRHHLFNVKVIATETLTFALLAANLVQFFLTQTVTSRIISLLTTIILFYFSILLIKSVLREVEQREQLQKLTEELQVANKKLDELNKFKSDMLSLASHDIKRPLATIKGFASILIDGLYGPVTDKMKETLIKMKNSTDELVTLVESLLNLRRVEEGYKFEPTKLNDLITGVIGDLKQAAAEKKIELSFTPEADLSTNADSQKLKEAIKNIIDNALKYTPAGSVKVSLKEENGYAIISVIDSGLGIPSNLLPRLFGEEFVRDERFKHEIRGTGLGLYLTGKIIAAHAGTVWAESAGEGKGSKFFIKLRKIT